ncbi:hypothetical protein WJX77_010198 [Trebouxia sp. C0004]
MQQELYRQLQLPFASTELSGQQGWSPAFSNAEAELPGLQGWSPAVSMPLNSRAQAQPSAGLTELRLVTDSISSLGSFDKTPAFLKKRRSTSMSTIMWDFVTPMETAAKHSLFLECFSVATKN